MASDSFWQKLLLIEKNFFNSENIISLLQQDSNQSILLDKNETSLLLDNQFEAFSSLIALLKKNPYALDVNETIFFDKEKTNQKIRDLRLKIQTNQRYGYTLAVQRDTIKLTSLELREQIYDFFKYLAKNWTVLNQKDIQKYIEQNHQILKSKVKIEEWSRLYKTLKGQSGTIPQQITNNFLILAQDYYFFDSFLSYLTLNSSSLNYHSLSSRLKIDNLIAYINQQLFAQKSNLYLRYFKLDMGRVILFILVILLFVFLNYLLYRRLYFYFQSKILKEKDENDDILLENLKKIRLPVSLFINGIGLKLALEVLDYPNNLSERTNLYFALFFIILLAYIAMQIIENLFFIYFHHTTKRNLTLRTELINLMLSVSKALILLVALIVILLKLDINVSGVIASLGIGGLAVALAAKDTLSNFFGLLKIIFDESFSQGDWIETSDVEGTVVEIGFISTKIRTFDNAMITVPNEKLANTSIKNWSRRKVGRRIKFYVGVTYSSNLADVQNAINDINDMLIAHEGISTSEKINTKELKRHYRHKNRLVSLDNKLGIKSTLLVYLDKFSDSSIDILIYSFSKTTNWQEWLEVKQDVLYKVWEILEKNRLEFAFPSQSIYIEKSETDKELI
jgi:MscS family membrane protein